METTTNKTGYQGHKDRGHWSVALFLDNDAGAYRIGQDYVSRWFANEAGLVTPRDVAAALVSRLADLGCTRSFERYKLTVERVAAWVVDEIEERKLSMKGGK